MKKHHLLLPVLLTGLLLIIIIIMVGIPYLVSKDSTRQAVTEKIKKTYNIKLKTDNLQWSWLPVPHLESYGSRLTYQQGLTCNLHQLKVYPDWKSIFSGRIQARRIEIQQPHFIIKPTLFRQGLPEIPRLPVTDIIMQKASLRLDSPVVNNFPALTLDLSRGEFKLKHSVARLYLSIEAVTSCSEKVFLKGWYNPLTRHYSVSASLKNFHLHKLISFSSGPFSPLASEVDMEWSCSGALGSGFEVSFRGNLPAFTLRRGEEQSPPDTRQTGIRFRKADFDFKKNRQGIFFKARDISLAKPVLSLAGRVNRLTAEKKPVYQLDLRGRKIDLKGVRRSLLNMLDDNKITRQVCDIVRGGKAAEATYKFKGPASDFKNLENMRISVDVDTSEIRVPGTNLDLDQTKGPILIENGELTGEGLETSLGNSSGSNARLALGLTPDNDLFKLEIDLDADIAELPDILHHLIEKQLFRQEVKKFKGRGQARAHLSIGNSLTDFQTRVDLKDGTGATINYDRLDQPITFKNGLIKVVNQEIKVRDCTIQIGHHHFSDISGAVFWTNGKPRMDIGKLEAEIDATDFLNYLRRYSKIKNTIDPHLESIEGRVGITGSKLSGPFASPEKWDYLLNLQLKDTGIVTPHLAGRVDIKKARVQLKKDQITLDNTDLIYRQSPISMKARLNHELFEKWQGYLELSGTLEPLLAEWLKDKKGLPPSLLPLTPCQFDNFRINLEPDKLGLKGAISREDRNKEIVRMDMELEKKKSDIKKLYIQYTTATDRAAFNLQKHPDQGRISLSWQGSLQADTLTALFKKPPFTKAGLQGDFQAVFSPETGNVEAEGYLKIRNLQWRSYLPGTIIKKLTIKGKGPLIKIEDLDFDYHGEEAEINGTIDTRDRQPVISLFLSSDFLSRKNIAEFAEEALPLWEKASRIFSQGGSEVKPSYKIYLNCETFLFSAPENKKGWEGDLRLTPLKGRIHSDEQDIELNLQDCGLCGLVLNGTLLYQDGQLRLLEINGSTPDNQTTYFENTLPCLGIKDSAIKGSFIIDFSTKKEKNKYSKGEINIYSDNGKILKWGLLAKIFQVVNITELGNLLKGGGFNYDKLTGKGHISNNKLIMDKAELKGQGLDLLARGEIDLQKMSMDVTVFLVPFKTIDAILHNIPLVGRLIQGRGGHIITIPIGVKGDLTNPAVTNLPPKAVGQGAINFIMDTISFPLDIIPGQTKE